MAHADDEAHTAQGQEGADAQPLPVGAGLVAGTGLARGISAGLQGDELTSAGLLQAVGGVRGILEALVPGVLYLAVFIVTQDARVSVIAPAALAILAFAVRIVMRQPVVTALSGVFGVAICVATTLMTGKGEDYFLPGFWINGAWTVAILVSLLVRWPVIGFIVGGLQGDLTGWRRVPAVRKMATIASLIWLGMFVLRLAVQLPLYVAGDVAGLGIARLVMGTPLFALVILCTWLLFRNMPRISQLSTQ